MRWSAAFIPTLREEPKDAEAISHKLMVRAGCIRRLGSGTYSYLPLGLRVLNKVQAIIRDEMNHAGAQELLLPALHPPELWKTTGRLQTMEDVLFAFTDRHGRENILGATHEEVVTDLVKGEVRSYKQLPVILYQIQTKFRDEPRPRFGVIRSREFLMKDAYSFNRSVEELDRTYQTMYEAYQRIFQCCGLSVIACEADPGVMGGKVSHEFMAPAEAGEDFAVACQSCHTARSVAPVEPPPASEPCAKCGKPVSRQRTIEIGHVFKLGTKYSDALGAVFQDEDGKSKPIIMGCYGIGVNRIIACAIEQHHDANGIIWPQGISPYAVLITLLDREDSAALRAAATLEEQLAAAGHDVLIDDRDLSAGVKLKDGDLIGIPLRVIVGSRSLKQGGVELSERGQPGSHILPVDKALTHLASVLGPTS
ncbi:MAG: proline--tRNA ligase [Candidatus Omnitrophica bacterium]|nr:proline--tRNA ligase [Candidatus Omnitrophota bacterium]